MRKNYPPLEHFLQTWMAGVSAPKSVFAGQTCKMVQEICLTVLKAGYAEALTDLDEQPYTAKEISLALPKSLEEDVLLALRFMYYVKHRPLLPDEMYDAAEREYLDRPDVEDSPLMQPGSDKRADYPDRVIALAFYLHTCACESIGQAPAAKDVFKEAAPVASASPSPVSTPGKGKGAKTTPEVTTGELF